MNQLNLDLLSDTRTNIVTSEDRYDQLVTTQLLKLANFNAYDIGQLLGELLSANYL